MEEYFQHLKNFVRGELCSMYVIRGRISFMLNMKYIKACRSTCQYVFFKWVKPTDIILVMRPMTLAAWGWLEW